MEVAFRELPLVDGHVLPGTDDQEALVTLAGEGDYHCTDSRLVILEMDPLKHLLADRIDDAYAGGPPTISAWVTKLFRREYLRDIFIPIPILYFGICR